jgi:hypothetical protein
MTTQQFDSKARRSAKRIGLVACKSRRKHPLENHGGFMLVDPQYNFAVAGFHYDFSAKDVIEWCETTAPSKN